jgi:phage shock protein PspC (stress-responsive transcriptional regulator)
MNKVIIINLNGNAYQLEENGYEALRAYLDTAARRLEGNPDRDEIVADIEQSIADKFRALLGAAKTVVMTREVEGVIAEMGPVEDATGGGAADGDPGKQGAPETPKPAFTPSDPAGSAKRLYKINDGAMVAGVCTGLAAYLNIDVTIIRIFFVVTTVFWGLGGLLYLVMALLVPSATTSAERAAAYGAPFTAQEFIKRARHGYYEGMKTFKDKRAYREWKRTFREEMRGWKRNFRREMHQHTDRWAHNWRNYGDFQPHPGSWIVLGFLGLIRALVMLTMVFALLSLVLRGTVLGIAPPVGVPLWAAFVFVFICFQLLILPLKAMSRGLLWGGYGHRYTHPCLHFWNAAFSIGLVLVLVWYANHHSAQVHEALMNLPPEVHRMADSVRQWWARQ